MTATNIPRCIINVVAMRQGNNNENTVIKKPDTPKHPLQTPEKNLEARNPNIPPEHSSADADPPSIVTNSRDDTPKRTQTSPSSLGTARTITGGDTPAATNASSRTIDVGTNTEPSGGASDGSTDGSLSSLSSFSDSHNTLNTQETTENGNIVSEPTTENAGTPLNPEHIDPDTMSAFIQLKTDLSSMCSLSRPEQEKLLTEKKEMLENIDTTSFPDEQKKVVQTLKENIAIMENATALVNKSPVNKMDILKAAGGFAVVAASLTALGALISLLIKINAPTSTDKTDSIDGDSDSDQTDAITAKEKDIQDDEKHIKDLEDKKQNLIDQHSDIFESEAEITKKTRDSARMEYFKEGGDTVLHDLTEDNKWTNIRPSDAVKAEIDNKILEKLVEHREVNAQYQDKINEIINEEHTLNDYKQELEILKEKQVEYEKVEYEKKATTQAGNSNIKPEIITLGAFLSPLLLATAGFSGAFGINKLKLIPKFKIYRARQQASRNVNKLINSNDPPVSGEDNPKNKRFAIGRNILSKFKTYRADKQASPEVNELMNSNPPVLGKDNPANKTNENEIEAGQSPGKSNS